MIGACPWVIPASWHIPIIDTRQRLRPKRLLTREELLDYDLEIRQAYHGIVDAMLHPALPVLENTDGDPLELTTLTYELGVTVTEAVERPRPDRLPERQSSFLFGRPRHMPSHRVEPT